MFLIPCWERKIYSYQMFSLDADILSPWFGTGCVQVSFWTCFKYLSRLVLVCNSLMNKKFCWLHKCLGVSKRVDEVGIHHPLTSTLCKRLGWVSFIWVLHMHLTNLGTSHQKSKYLSRTTFCDSERKETKTEDSEHWNKQKKMLTLRLCFPLILWN